VATTPKPVWEGVKFTRGLPTSGENTQSNERQTNQKKTTVMDHDSVGEKTLKKESQVMLSIRICFGSVRGEGEKQVNAKDGST